MACIRHIADAKGNPGRSTGVTPEPAPLRSLPQRGTAIANAMAEKFQALLLTLGLALVHQALLLDDDDPTDDDPAPTL